MKMRLERRAASLIPGRKVSWGSSYGPGCGASLLPRTARSPVAFAGWNTTSELTEVGDFRDGLSNIPLFNALAREPALGDDLAGCPFLGGRKQRPGTWKFYSKILTVVQFLSGTTPPIKIKLPCRKHQSTSLSLPCCGFRASYYYLGPISTCSISSVFRCNLIISVG